MQVDIDARTPEEVRHYAKQLANKTGLKVAIRNIIETTECRTMRLLAMQYYQRHYTEEK